MLCRSPCVATDISAPSDAQKITRRRITPAGAASGTRDEMISTATIATTMTAESCLRWNSAVHTSGIKITMPTPLVEPAASSRASTEPTYSSGTITGVQSGSRDQGSRNAAAVATSSSTLASTAAPEWGPGGKARLTSARIATAANGSTRGHSDGPWNGTPVLSPGAADIAEIIADSARYPMGVKK